MKELARIGRVVLALALLFLDAAPARADGGVLQAIGVESAVEVKAQRAVIWQTGGGLEVTIEPIFTWAGDGAWVIPLPALPQVTAADPALLSELDRATAPVFLEACIDYGCCCGDLCDVGAGGPTSATATSAVTVWSSGEVGGLDYVVLSTVNGDSLVAWATTNGFVLGEAAAAAIDELEIAGSFFFIARVSPDANLGRALAPVTFRFGPDVPPFYPLRFTGSLLPQGRSLDVVLWLVTEPGVAYHPSGVPWIRADLLGLYECEYDWGGTSPDDYEDALQTWFDAEARGGLVVEYWGPLEHAPGLTGSACTGFGEQICSDVPVVALTTDVAQAMVSYESRVMRLRGRLRDAGLASDLAFASTYPPHDELRGTYSRCVGSCGGECHCPPAPERTETVGEPEKIEGTETSNADHDTLVEAAEGTSGCAAGGGPQGVSALILLAMLVAARQSWQVKRPG
jgi:hypothetical protein